MGDHPNFLGLHLFPLWIICAYVTSRHIVCSTPRIKSDDLKAVCGQQSRGCMLREADWCRQTACCINFQFLCLTVKVCTGRSLTYLKHWIFFLSLHWLGSTEVAVQLLWRGVKGRSVLSFRREILSLQQHVVLQPNQVYWLIKSKNYILFFSTVNNVEERETAEDSLNLHDYNWILWLRIWKLGKKRIK